MNNDEITNKILESGFIEAFFDNYYYLKHDKTSSDDRLDFDLCISKKEKIKLTKKKLKECNEIIKKSAYSDISSDFIRDYRSFKSEKEEINVFSNYYKNSITSFEPITNFFSVYDNSLSFQNFYKYNYPEYLQPNIIDVEDIWRQEERLLNFFLETIENFEINQIWEIDFDEIYFLKDYSIPIKNLIDLAELYFNIKRMFIYRSFLEEDDKRTPINFENNSITFSKKLEDFFIQTNYCLVLSPEPMLLGKKGNINLMLPPQQFFKIINDYKIEYPFLIDVKIQELKSLMKSENISINEGISIFEAFKTHYNPIDSVSIFQPVLDLFNNGLKINNPTINEIEIIKEQVELNKYFIAIKHEFHNKLYQSLFSTTQIDLINEAKIINSNQNFDFDEDVYKLNLEYFLSVNPKANEQFFIKTKISELEKSTKELFQQINFSCDNLNSIEGQLNNQNRKDYFFRIQYLEYLKDKYNETSNLSNKKNISDDNKIIENESKSILDLNFRKIELLNTIWLPNAKISVNELLEKGYEKGMSNKNLKITLKRGSIYGSKVSFLGALYLCFKGTSIKNEIDFKEAGCIFFEVFEISVKESTKEPYKLFSSAKEKIKKEIKRTFQIR